MRKAATAAAAWIKASGFGMGFLRRSMVQRTKPPNAAITNRIRLHLRNRTWIIEKSQHQQPKRHCGNYTVRKYLSPGRGLSLQNRN